MNTLNYIGCKKRLFCNILQVCQDNIDIMEELSFLDLFAGSGIVSYKMSSYFKQIIANDLETYSFIINSGSLKCDYTEHIEKIIDECNRLEPINGLIFQNYSSGGEKKRMFFSIDNACKCDAIRQYIQTLYENSTITENEYNFLLASLLVSVDGVANTTCVYGAYLKKLKISAEKKFVLIPIHKKII